MRFNEINLFGLYFIEPSVAAQDAAAGVATAAQADAPGARKFNKAVNELIAAKDSAKNAEIIEKMLNDWRNTQADLQNLMENAPSLAEARQLSTDFQSLTRIAQEAFADLKLRRVKTAAGFGDKSAEWREAQLKVLDEIAKPKAALEFMIVESVKKMVVEISVK